MDLAEVQREMWARAWRFPADVPGWLTENEGRLLYDLACELRWVEEVGSYLGRSTVCLARGAHRVVSIDPHDMRGVVGLKRDTWAEFQENLTRSGVCDRVEAFRMTYEAFCRDHPPAGSRPRLVFIDSDHNYRTCRRHAALACARLAGGGLLAFHDYGRDADEMVTLCVDGILAGGGRMVRLLDDGDDHLAVVDPGGWRKCT